MITDTLEFEYVEFVTDEITRQQSKERRAQLHADGYCINGQSHGPPVDSVRCAWCKAVHRKGLAAVLADPAAPPRPHKRYRPRRQPDVTAVG